MRSKAFLIPGLLLAVFLLISSGVAAKDEKKQEKATNVNGVNDAKYGGYPGGGYPGGGYPGGGYPGGGYPGGGYPGGPGGGYPGGGYPGGGYPGGGYPGGGYPGGGYPGGGNPGRGGGNPGQGYCRYGCCDRGRNYGRGCGRCCPYAGAAADATTEVKPHN